MRIDQIAIKDFKALKDVSFSPGRVNVLIGANGSGKSTLLEAIGILSAAMTDRVDGNSLLRKGVRLSAPNLYKSAFRDMTRSKTMTFEMEWQNNTDEESYRYNVHLFAPSDDNVWRYHSETLSQGNEQIWGRSGRSKETNNNIGMLYTDQSDRLLPMKLAVEPFGSYAIYQPFTAALRGIVPDPQQAIPIGLNGGRLAEALEEIIHDADGDKMVGGKHSIYLDDILEVIDWANSISIGSPTKERVNAAVPVSRRVLEFQDRFLKETTKFTAYDASEGALYILFMFCLALHPKSPTVFAIDNFDQAMHPRLAKAVMKKISDIIIAQSKTVFITTHNPLVLDGLDLSNDDIRLFTLNRSRKNGNVNIERIQISSELIKEKMSLSQLWTSGRIGGVPELI